MDVGLFHFGFSGLYTAIALVVPAYFWQNTSNDQKLFLSCAFSVSCASGSLVCVRATQLVIHDIFNAKLLY